MKVIVGITGSTGVVLGIRLLEVLKELEVETHLILSRWAKTTLSLETDYEVKDVESLASVCYADRDQAAAISSGSFKTEGMIIAPCSMKTLAGIRHGYADDLIGRSADVTLKERRPLLLLARESPFNVIHLENMLGLARMGVTIIPPMLSFYQQPETIDHLIDHVVARTLDHIGLEMPGAYRWEGSTSKKMTLLRNKNQRPD